LGVPPSVVKEDAAKTGKEKESAAKKDAANEESGSKEKEDATKK